jgi:hypothetical protein
VYFWEEEEEEKSNGFSFQRKPQPEQKMLERLKKNALLVQSVRRDNNTKVWCVVNPSHDGSLPKLSSGNNKRKECGKGEVRITKRNFFPPSPLL